MRNNYDVIVIGAGAAGMMAAITAANRKYSVLVIEQKKQEGSKILVTGKGRCNITNDSDVLDILNNVMTNPTFLYSALYAFPPSRIIEYFNSIGVKTVTERGRRVFPESSNAIDVRNALVYQMQKAKVDVLKLNKVTEVVKGNDEIYYVTVKDANGVTDSFGCVNLVFATGGMTYQSTGSDGSGYVLAKNLGHSVTELKGALTGLLTKERWVNETMGLTLKNVSLTVLKDDKAIYKEQGELLFTHFGISGPIVLTASRYLLDTDYKNAKAVIDLKPALDEQTLYKRITLDMEKNASKKYANSLDALLPKSLIPVIVKLSGISPDKMSNQISKDEKKSLVRLLKNLTLTIRSGMEMDDAIVTKGGIPVNEINPSTMESRISQHLFFAGEIIDCDALTGGYNLTIAFSTGFLAGDSVYL
ncbi:MAG: NAD(P)/FAD-dependent oxidoreductase [Clostridiaceae bacterium]|nr:NAD(P)/FAD-dependent oxidoreductase [Clostridiaceae bacterium]